MALAKFGYGNRQQVTQGNRSENRLVVHDSNQEM